MTRTQAVARILEEIGFRAAGSSLDTTIISRLQEAQRELESGKTLPLFLLQENQTLSLVLGAHTVALPSGFIREEPDNLIHYFPTNSDVPIWLERRLYIDAEMAQITNDDETAQAPQVYVILKDTIDFITNADANYTLYWSYYKRAATLTTDIENEWLGNLQGGAEWLIGEAGYRLAKSLRDQSAIQSFDDMRKTGRAALLGEIIAREESGGPYAMGMNA